jgi:hypothetical protein
LEILIYRPDAEKAETRTLEGSTYKDVRDIFANIIGPVERVSVLFEGAGADMFVNEYGAGKLPYNALATDIYHAYSKSRGVNTANAPSIYGVAIVAVNPRRIYY